MFNQKQNTIVVKGVTSCVFDDLLIFNMKGLSKDQVEEEVIRISCYDANSIPLAGSTLIGYYAVDMQLVYTKNKDHELYRQWVPLVDDSNPADTGVQGYLKVSIQVIGPGDKLKIHDEV